MIGGVLYIVLLWKWHVSRLPYCLPHSLLPPPPPPPPSTLPRSLLSSSCLPHCLPHFPTSFTPSLPPSPWLSYITICLTDSPAAISHTLPHSLPLSLSHSLPCIALPHPIPSHSPASLIHFSSLSHCLTFPSLTFLPYSLPQSLPCLPNSLFLHSVIASLTPPPPPPPPTPPNSFLPYSISTSITPRLPYSLPHLLPILLYMHSLPDSLTPLHHSLPHLLHLIHSSSSLLVSLPVSFTPLHHSLLHPIPSHSPASLIHFFVTQSLPHSPLPNSFLPLYSFHHSLLTHSLPHSRCLIHSAVSPSIINSLVCLLLASFTP